MRHLRRAVVLLVAVLIIIFVVPRVISSQTGIEDYGFYPDKSEENTRLWASQPLRYADPAVCNTCHKDNSALWSSSKHSSVSCENCHGPGERHVENIIPLKVDRSRETCTVCHAQLPARPADFPQINLGEHGGQLACVTCHNPHQPETVKAAAQHDNASCLTCHEGGITPPPESCLNCHRS